MRPRSATAPMARAGLLIGEVSSVRLCNILTHTLTDSNNRHVCEELASVPGVKWSVEHVRNGGKHALVKAKENIGSISRATGLSQGLHQAKVSKISNEAFPSGSSAEHQAVSPKEPLKAHDTDGNHGQENKLQRRLSPRETAVEEADTGNHEQYENGGYDQEGHMASLKRRNYRVSIAPMAFSGGVSPRPDLHRKTRSGLEHQTSSHRRQSQSCHCNPQRGP